MRRGLLESVVVIDAAPSVMDLDGELRAEVFWAVERKHHGVFLEHLEGWWLRRTLKQLASIASGDRILAGEIEAQMSDLREQFKQDSLPIDDDLLNFDLDDATQAAHAGSNFVRQLELVTAGKRRIAAAVRDYYRAFEQRSRWLRNELLLVGDLSRYERSLVEEWELVFEAMKDDLGSNVAEDAKRKAALDVLKWAERVSLRIRPNVTEPPHDGDGDDEGTREPRRIHAPLHSKVSGLFTALLRRAPHVSSAARVTRPRARRHTIRVATARRLACSRRGRP